MSIINNKHCFFYLFFIIGNPSRHFVYITKKSSPVNIVSRKINRQNPASISTYTQSEYRISNYVNHISIITWFTAGHGVSFIESRHEIDEKVVESSQIEDACRLKHYRWVNKHVTSRQRRLKHTPQHRKSSVNHCLHFGGGKNRIS